MRFEVENLLELLETNGQTVLTPTQDDLAIHCPFCPESDPDLKGKCYISPSKYMGIYHCFRCHASGPIASLLRRLGIAYGNVVVSTEKLVERAAKLATLKKFRGKDGLPRKMLSIELPEDYIRLTKESCTGTGAIAYRWLRRRGLGWKSIREWKIGFCARGFFAQHLILPVMDQKGKVVTFQARRFIGTFEPKSRNPKIPGEFTVSKTDVMYGIHRAVRGGCAVIVEGPFDVIHLAKVFGELGLENFFALGLFGHEVGPVQIATLASMGLEKIWVMLDSDAIPEAWSVGGKILRSVDCPVYISELQKGDPDDHPARKIGKILLDSPLARPVIRA